MKEKFSKNKHTLVLNLDFQPFNITSWEKAFVKSYFEPFSMSILEVYKKSIVDSRGNEYPIPAVVCLKKYQKHHQARLTKKNIFTRDGFVCSYCGSSNDLTIDHIIPRCKTVNSDNFFVNSWENLTTACMTCNYDKGDIMPHLFKPLLSKPYKPTKSQLLSKILSINCVPKEWEKFLERPHDKKKKTEAKSR